MDLKMSKSPTVFTVTEGNNGLVNLYLKHNKITNRLPSAYPLALSQGVSEPPHSHVLSLLCWNVFRVACPLLLGWKTKSWIRLLYSCAHLTASFATPPSHLSPPLLQPLWPSSSPRTTGSFSPQAFCTSNFPVLSPPAAQPFPKDSFPNLSYIKSPIVLSSPSTSPS